MNTSLNLNTPTPSKNISGISVVFDWDARDRGEAHGYHSQADIVDAYGQRLNEELEYENVRIYPIDSRRAPARDGAAKTADIPAGFVPVFLSCDWHKNPRTTNSSTVEFSGAHLYRLADALCFALSEWGNCTVFGHRTMRPIAVEGDPHFIRIKPFALNGPHAADYVKRLDKLGEDLGRAIGGYLKNRGEGLMR